MLFSYSFLVKINIEIGDVNDNVPQFLPSNATVLIFEAQEETAPSTIIATLQAVDVDDGLAGEVRFSIAAEDDASPILIESETGMLPNRYQVSS